ncbi:hypothetical protein ACHAXR_002184, partial [Thalassiosira sp. AJA248-18]
AFWIFAFFAFLFLSAGSSREGKKKKREKKLRNKAETMPEVEVTKTKDFIKKIELNEKYDQLNDAHAKFEDHEDSLFMNADLEDQEDLDKAVSRVFDGVEMAEEDEIETNNSMLSSAVQTMEESVRFYIGRVFGYGDEELDDDDDTAMSETSADIQLSEEQLDAIAKKISDRLESDVKSEFRAKADSVRDEKVLEIDKVLAEDKNSQMTASQIAHDVHEAETMVVEDLKDEIDDAANRVKDEIPEKVKRIRNEVVEEVTGKKLSTPPIVQDDIERKKLRKKERKAELMKRFKEMQEKAKQVQAEKEDIKDEILKRNYRKSDDGVLRTRQYPPKLESKGEKYPPLKKEKETESKDTPWGPKPKDKRQPKPKFIPKSYDSGDEDDSKDKQRTPKPNLSVEKSPKSYRPKSYDSGDEDDEDDENKPAPSDEYSSEE